MDGIQDDNAPSIVTLWCSSSRRASALRPVTLLVLGPWGVPTRDALSARNLSAWGSAGRAGSTYVTKYALLYLEHVVFGFFRWRTVAPFAVARSSVLPERHVRGCTELLRADCFMDAIRDDNAPSIDTLRSSSTRRAAVLWPATLLVPGLRRAPTGDALSA